MRFPYQCPISTDHLRFITGQGARPLRRPPSCGSPYRKYFGQSFIVFVFTFRLLVHSELLFIGSITPGSNFTLRLAGQRLLQTLSFPTRPLWGEVGDPAPSDRAVWLCRRACAPVSLKQPSLSDPEGLSEAGPASSCPAFRWRRRRGRPWASPQGSPAQSPPSGSCHHAEPEPPGSGTAQTGLQGFCSLGAGSGPHWWPPPSLFLLRFPLFSLLSSRADNPQAKGSAGSPSASPEPGAPLLPGPAGPPGSNPGLALSNGYELIDNEQKC